MEGTQRVVAGRDEWYEETVMRAIREASEEVTFGLRPGGGGGKTVGAGCLEIGQKTKASREEPRCKRSSEVT